MISIEVLPGSFRDELTWQGLQRDDEKQWTDYIAMVDPNLHLKHDLGCNHIQHRDRFAHWRTFPGQHSFFSAHQITFWETCILHLWWLFLGQSQNRHSLSYEAIDNLLWDLHGCSISFMPVQSITLVASTAYHTWGLDSCLCPEHHLPCNSRQWNFAPSQFGPCYL